MNKRIGSNVVTKSPMYGGGVVYTAWEPSSIMGPHSTITFIDGVCYGDIATRRIGTDIEKMKGGSPERIRACHAHQAQCQGAAYDVIFKAFGEEIPLVFERDSGRIRAL